MCVCVCVCEQAAEACTPPQAAGGRANKRPPVGGLYLCARGMNCKAFDWHAALVLLPQ